MIVASPCAVVLATMPPLLAAMANAGRHGVLVKSAVVMEQIGQTTQVAFDKTGTLTHGAPHLASTVVLPGPAWIHGSCWLLPLPRRTCRSIPWPVPCSRPHTRPG